MVCGYDHPDYVFFIDKEGRKNQLKRVLIEGEFWVVEKTLPFSIKKYIDANSKLTKAEVLSFNSVLGDIDLILADPDNLNSDRKLIVKRIDKKTKEELPISVKIIKK